MNEVPLPMFFSHYVFSERFFTFWIAVSMCVFLTFLCTKFLLKENASVVQNLGTLERNVLRFTSDLGIPKGGCTNHQWLLDVSAAICLQVEENRNHRAQQERSLTKGSPFNLVAQAALIYEL
jgi:hypothetical protein